MVIGSNDKPCSLCEAVFPYTGDYFCLDKRNKTGLSSYCRECKRKYNSKEKKRVYRIQNKEKINKWAREYYHANKEKFRLRNRQYGAKPETKERAYRSRILKSYAITWERYKELLSEQGGVCAICGGEKGSNRLVNYLSVDHDHETKEIRGLLCNDCNLGLGNFKDNPTLMSKAIEYLNKKEKLCQIPKKHPKNSS